MAHYRRHASWQRGARNSNIPVFDVNAYLCKDTFMRTTIDVPDELFRRLKAKAALEGTTLRLLVTGLIRTGLGKSERPSPTRRRRSKLPTIRSRGNWIVPNLTSELQANLDEQDDLVRYGRSSRR